MKFKKIICALSICFALFLAISVSVSAEEYQDTSEGSKITGNAELIYVGEAVMKNGDYLLYDAETGLISIADKEDTIRVGADNCVGRFADGVLTLGGTAVFKEKHSITYGEQTITTWGVIGAVNPRARFEIALMDNADISLDSDYYSGIYGNYAPVVISGCGKITINMRNMQENVASYGIQSYCDVPADTAVSIANGAHININGSGAYGISLMGGTAINEGSIKLSTGGAVEVDGMPAANVTKDILTVSDGFRKIIAGDDKETALEYERNSLTQQLSDYSYIQIDTGSGVYIRDIEMIKNREYTYVVPASETSEGQNRTLKYIEETSTLQMSGTGYVEGSDDPNSERYGAAIGSEHHLTIELLDGADIKIKGGIGSVDPASGAPYACSLYAFGPDANLTIKGNGKLTVTSGSSAARTDAIMSWDTNPLPADPNEIKENVVIESGVELIALGGPYGHGIATYANNSLYQHGWAIIKGADAYIYGGDCAVLVHTDNGLLRDKDGNPNEGYTMDKATIKAADADGKVIGYNGLELTGRTAIEDGKEIKEMLFGEKYKYLWIKPQKFYERTLHIGEEQIDTTDHHYIDDEELAEERKTGISTGFVTEITPITNNPDEMFSFSSIYWKFQYYPAEGIEESNSDSTWNGTKAGYKFSRKFLFPYEDYVSHGEELFPIEERMKTTVTLHGGSKLYVVVMVDGLCKDTAILEKSTDGNNETIYPPWYPPTAVIY